VCRISNAKQQTTISPDDSLWLKVVLNPIHIARHVGVSF
jgi:hypothetical protein